MKPFMSLFALFLTACTVANYESYSGLAIGTSYSVVARGGGMEVAKKIEETFVKIDTTFSIFNPHSLVSRINRGERTEVNELFADCFRLAESVNIASYGWFDPTVGPLVEAWGFGPGKAEEAPNVDSLMEFVGMWRVRLDDIFVTRNGERIYYTFIYKEDARIKLDFSSIAKGLAVDKLAEMLDDAGATDYMIEVGGEIRVRGVNRRGQPWRIGIDRPRSGLGRETVEIFEMTSGAVATSGNYRNWFADEQGRQRVHTISPKTGLPTQGEIVSATVFAPSCALADAWATAAMACGDVATAEKLLTRAGLKYYVMTAEAIHTK